MTRCCDRIEIMKVRQYIIEGSSGALHHRIEGYYSNIANILRENTGYVNRQREQCGKHGTGKTGEKKRQRGYQRQFKQDEINGYQDRYVGAQKIPADV